MSTNTLAQVQDDSTQVNRPALIASPEDTSLVNQNNRPNPQSGLDSSTQTTQNQQSSRATVPDAVQFQSQDSLVVDFKNGRTASLYGAAKFVEKNDRNWYCTWMGRKGRMPRHQLFHSNKTF